MLKIWGRRSAFNVQKVLWAIGELDLEHEHVDAGGATGGLDSPEFRAMNPHGRIPVVVEAGTTVWESHSILRYLVARHAAGSLWAADPSMRSLADRWMDWTLVTLGPDFMTLFWSFYRTPEAQRNEQVIARASRRCAAHFALLDTHLTDRQFLAGADFGMGDIPAGTTLYRYFEMGIETPELPNLKRWYLQLSERPAYREHVMLDFSALRGRLDF